MTDRDSTVKIQLVREPAQAWALDVQDDSGSRSVPISDRPLMVGSSRGVDLVMADPTVSGRHLELAVLGHGIAVRDCNSKNGTFIGTARVKEVWAESGTLITIGRSSIVCRAATHEDQDVGAEPLRGVAGGSANMRHIAGQVRRFAKYSAPVLIMGESGTGKELIARALHSEGPRGGGPFIALNVTTLPRELVESELFGHERGAFTGAHQRRVGAFTEAKDGTLFLDEIGDLPLDAQPKLLRALDGYEFRRVGASASNRASEARVIAATNVALEHKVAEGRFRRDLFHRLEVFVVSIPPLRERRADIAPIARDLLARMQHDHGKRALTTAAIARLASHDWPGNVRELRNVLIRAADLAGDQEVLDVAEVERGLGRIDGARDRPALNAEVAQALMKQYGSNLSAAARAAQCPRTTFRKLLNSKK